MPNGRSGGFRIALVHFRKLLHDSPGEAPAGQVLVNGRFEKIAVTELARRLDRYAEEDLPVEEQDHRWYIVHLGPDPEGWILIKEDSPLHKGFRTCHAEWVKSLSQGH